MEQTTTLYLVNVYEAYRADEQGITVMTSEPIDTIYYKHEVLAEKTITLPKGVEYNEERNVWFVNGNPADLFFEDGQVSLISADGIKPLCEF